MVTFQQLGNLGRFGNGLFQIAACIGYSRKHNMDFFLPLWKYENMFKHGFNQSNMVTNFPTYQEPHFHYAEIPEFKNVNLSGYFQTEKYFKHCEKDVRDLFTFKDYITYDAEVFIETHAEDRIPVSVHVRRTDYITMGHYYHNLTMEWYKEAMDKFDDSHHFFIMSDDIEFCRAKFNFRKNITFCGFDEVKDMVIGINSKHNIIANSSFSWWQAWLNPNPDKIVIAPKDWFKPVANHDTKDLYIPNSILL